MARKRLERQLRKMKRLRELAEELGAPDRVVWFDQLPIMTMTPTQLGSMLGQTEIELCCIRRTRKQQEELTQRLREKQSLQWADDGNNLYEEMIANG